MSMASNIAGQGSLGPSIQPKSSNLGIGSRSKVVMKAKHTPFDRANVLNFEQQKEYSRQRVVMQAASGEGEDKPIDVETVEAVEVDAVQEES